MTIPILRNGQDTEEADDALDFAADATGLKAEVIKAMVIDMRTALNQAGGINCSDERADQLWAEVQRKHGVKEIKIQPPYLRRH